MGIGYGRSIYITRITKCLISRFSPPLPRHIQTQLLNIYQTVIYRAREKKSWLRRVDGCAFTLFWWRAVLVAFRPIISTLTIAISYHYRYRCMCQETWNFSYNLSNPSRLLYLYFYKTVLSDLEKIDIFWKLPQVVNVRTEIWTQNCLMVYSIYLLL